jgi:hypothetical protein
MPVPQMGDEKLAAQKPAAGTQGFPASRFLPHKLPE